MRIQIIDLSRGIVLILMILFNYSITLNYFQVISLPSTFIYWLILPSLIGGTFILLSGMSAYASYKNKEKNFTKRYFIRGFKLTGFAILITLFTFIFVPQGTVYFGILHLFAITSFIVPFLIKYDKINLILGLIFVIFGVFLQLTQFDFPYLTWLGFMPKNFFTFDYFPLMPWLGVIMLGIYFGKHTFKKTIDIHFKGKLSNIFTFLGKHSLTIYLIHQPLLIMLLLFLGFRFYV